MGSSDFNIFHKQKNISKIKNLKNVSKFQNTKGTTDISLTSSEYKKTKKQSKKSLNLNESEFKAWNFDNDEAIDIIDF